MVTHFTVTGVRIFAFVLANELSILDLKKLTSIRQWASGIGTGKNLGKILYKLTVFFCLSGPF